ncbi:hypothetical protein BC332_13617 [Capsicum chinense]|nr:hypothetical protein BC332_13617 [Capsicum chinense]
MHCSNSLLSVLASVLTTFSIPFSGVPPVGACIWHTSCFFILAWDDNLPSTRTNCVSASICNASIGNYSFTITYSSVSCWEFFTQYLLPLNQQATLEGSQISSYNQYFMQPQPTLQRLDSQYDHKIIVNGKTLRSDYSDVNVNQGIETQDAGVPA